MKLSKQQQIFALNVAKLIAYIDSRGLGCTLGEAWRPEEMCAIYAKKGKGILHSLHTDRLAIDLNLFSPTGEWLADYAAYKPFGDYWQSLHHQNRWGGCFHDSAGLAKPDSDHFEMEKE
jgi:hypothetical protein